MKATLGKEFATSALKSYPALQLLSLCRFGRICLPFVQGVVRMSWELGRLRSMCRDCCVFGSSWSGLSQTFARVITAESG